MTRNLRIALTILSVGFALEGTEELYSLLTASSRVPGASALFVLPVLLAVVGLALVWVGKDEWDVVHRAHARKAGLLFVGSLTAGFVAIGIPALLYAAPGLGTPVWAEAIFGGAAGSLGFGLFLVYGSLVYHLASGISRIAILLAVAWSLVVAVDISLLLARNLSAIVLLVNHPTVTVPAFVSDAELLVSYLFVSYFLLLGAYVEVHVAVARGRVAAPGSMRVLARRIAPSPRTKKAKIDLR